MLRAERRKQLLAVAGDIIAADGLAALTMEKLSERANIAKPVVYKHFANRNQVAIALLEVHFKALRGFFEARLPKTATLGDYIATVVEASFAFESASDIPIRKITNGFSAGDEVNKFYLQEEAEMRDRWKNLLIMLQVPADISMIASTIIHGMVRTSVYYFANKEKDKLTETNKGLCKETLLRMLMANLQSLTGFDGDLAAKPLDFNEPVTRAVVSVS